MEPRFTSRLDEPFLLDRAPFDQLLAPAPNSLTPRLPKPVEPGHVPGRSARTSSSLDLINKDFYGIFATHLSGNVGAGTVQLGQGGEKHLHHHQHQQQQQHLKESTNPSRPSKSAVLPLAEVLNNEETHESAAGVGAFSGSLNDILIDTSSAGPRKRRKVDGPELLTLPKPQPKKPAKRPRIPPLLQGLHQPPPDARLFPPITGDGLRNALIERPEVQKPPAGTNGKSKAASGSQTEKEDERAQDAVKDAEEKKRKRNKWTDPETDDLLKGVARFGIGNWKKILECEDFSFVGRTAVDLKDRFRICCPDQYRKFRSGDGDARGRTRAYATSKSQTVPEKAVTSSRDTQTPSSKPKQSRRKRVGTHRKGPEDLARIGIQGPFFKSKRRERREFNEEDDEALMRGFIKHGASWNSILHDPEYAFDGRHPTDLRDRFRNRYPEKYLEAGYKIRPKETAAKQRGGSVDNDTDLKPVTSTGQSEKEALQPATTAPSSRIATSLPSANNAIKHNSIIPKSTASAVPLKPLLTSFSHQFVDDFPDFDLAEASHSPITLNRNILHWADQNPSHTTTALTTSATMATVTSANSAIIGPNDISTHFNMHMNLNLLTGMDQYHINPLATLNPTPPPALFPNSHLSSSFITSSFIPSNPPNPSKSSSAIHFSHSLPTLTIPPTIAGVGVNGGGNGGGIGGRSGTGSVSLPPPSNLLSGLDLREFDARDGGHAGSHAGIGGFIWDETLS